MSIDLDYRTGSGELEKLFLPYGIKVNRTKLEFGDLAFEGRGPHGACSIVIERKRITDLIQSMESRRLSGHQLPGMAERYDYCYLIVEGIWRRGEVGNLEISLGRDRWQAQGISSRAISNYLMGLSLRAGVIVWPTAFPSDTVSFVIDQYRMWNDKAWSEHSCHDAVYAPANGGEGRRLSFRPREITLREKIALQLPGLDAKARWAAATFGNVVDMVNADQNQWAGIEWVDKHKKKRKLGKVGAVKIWEALRG